MQICIRNVTKQIMNKEFKLSTLFAYLTAGGEFAQFIFILT